MKQRLELLQRELLGDRDGRGGVTRRGVPLCTLGPRQLRSDLAASRSDAAASTPGGKLAALIENGPLAHTLPLSLRWTVALLALNARLPLPEPMAGARTSPGRGAELRRLCEDRLSGRVSIDSKERARDRQNLRRFLAALDVDAPPYTLEVALAPGERMPELGTPLIYSATAAFDGAVAGGASALGLAALELHAGAPTVQSVDPDEQTFTIILGAAEIL